MDVVWDLLIEFKWFNGGWWEFGISHVKSCDHMVAHGRPVFHRYPWYFPGRTDHVLLPNRTHHWGRPVRQLLTIDIFCTLWQWLTYWQSQYFCWVNSLLKISHFQKLCAKLPEGSNNWLRPMTSLIRCQCLQVTSSQQKCRFSDTLQIEVYHGLSENAIKCH